MMEQADDQLTSEEQPAPAASAPARLRMLGVSKAFAGVQALAEVDLAIAPGEIYALVGENGAGKSTMMAIASGALRADDGRVLLDGRELAPGDPAGARDRGVAIVHQRPLLMPDLTVAEALLLGVPRHRRPASGRELRRWAHDHLSRWSTGRPISPGERVSGLAPNQRVAVEIVQALASEPALLILDEPTEYLGADEAELLFTRIREQAAAGCSVIYISHRIRDVKRLADRITVLRDGVTRGTYVSGELSEADIVELIAGRPLAAAFPPKPATLPQAARPLLELRGFRGSGFSPVDLELRAGEIVGLAGIDGNGQREFLRALAGLARARGGLRIDGEPAPLRRSHPVARKGIAYLPKDRHREGMLAGASVRENLALGDLAAVSRFGIVRPRLERRAAQEAITRFGIKAPTSETAMSALSGGNQQKVVLVGALEGAPAVLLADEPTQGVDIGSRTEIYQRLRDFTAGGHAVILLSADTLELEGLCDRVMVFSRGQVTTVLTGEDITEHNMTAAMLTATAERGAAGRRSPLALLSSDAAAPLIVAVAVIVLAVYVGGRNDLFLTARSLRGILALTATLALVTMGQQLVMLTGGIDLSVGPLMGLLAVVESFFLTQGAGPAQQGLGWVLLVAIAVVVGIVNWSLVDVARLHPMVATLVSYMALQAVSLILRPTPGGLISFGLISSISASWGIVPVALAAAVLAALAGQVWLIRSRSGMAVRGVGSDAAAARAAGLCPPRLRLLVYVGSSLCAAAAAIPLLAQVGTGDPTVGVNYTLASVAAAVVGGASIFGGRGTFVGCVAGALLIEEITSATTFLQLNAAWQSYLLGLMILLAVALYSMARRVTEARR